MPAKRKETLVFFSVDVEASGTLPGFYDLLSIGAVPVYRRHGEYQIGEEEFYVELKPVLGTSDPESMKVNRLDLSKLARDGVSLVDGAHQFARFVKTHTPRHDAPAFVGYCANFDWAFINDMFKRAGMDNPFGYKALDIRSLSYGLFELDWSRIGHTRLLQLLGMSPLSKAEAHHALADARHQAEMLVGLINRRGEIHRAP